MIYDNNNINLYVRRTHTC